MDRPSSYAVRWTEQAARDLVGITDFIAQQAPERARGVLDRLRQAASGLTDFPERGRVVPELARFGVVGLRELVVPPWRVLYRVDADRVTVLAVFDGRRDLSDVVFDRIMRT